MTRIVAEYIGRTIRFGLRYVEVLLRGQGRTLEVVNLAGNGREDPPHELVPVMYAYSARLYEPRRAKQKKEAIVTQRKLEGIHAPSRTTSDPSQ